MNEELAESEDYIITCVKCKKETEFEIVKCINNTTAGTVCIPTYIIACKECGTEREVDAFTVWTNFDEYPVRNWNKDDGIVYTKRDNI